jgi:hypothetical protein
MQYLATPAAVELARSMDVQSGTSLYAIFEGFKHRGIALDANLTSALDGFVPEIRDKMLNMLLKEADSHRAIMSAFTREDVYIESFSKVSGGPRDRKLMLWQDIQDNRDNLYDAANAAQQLLANLGYNRYAPNLLNKSHTTESKQKWSIKNFLKSTLKAGYETHGFGASTETGVSLTNSKEVTQSGQTTYTESDQHTGGWEYAMPYFRELGQTLGLIPPKTLVVLSSEESVEAAINTNTLDETYQRLRGTEVILLKAIKAALPKSLKDDTKLRYVLDNGYVEGALRRLLAKEKTVYNDTQTTYQKELDGELNWALHAVLYAALYRGARQRIEDIALRNTAKMIYSVSSNGDKELIYKTNREYSQAVPKDGYTMHTGIKNPTQVYNDQIQKIVGYTYHLKLPIHVVEDETRLMVTGYPELCANGRNCMDSTTAFTLTSYPPLSNVKCTTPMDAVLLRLDSNLDNLHSIHSDYQKEKEQLLIESMRRVVDSGATDTHKTTKLKA